MASKVTPPEPLTDENIDAYLDHVWANSAHNLGNESLITESAYKLGHAKHELLMASNVIVALLTGDEIGEKLAHTFLNSFRA